MILKISPIFYLSSLVFILLFLSGPVSIINLFLNLLLLAISVRGLLQVFSSNYWNVVRANIPIIILVILFIFAYLRTIVSGLLPLNDLVVLMVKISLILFSIIGFFSMMKGDDALQLHKYIAVVITFYVFINLFLYLIFGMQSENYSVNQGNFGLSSLMQLIGVNSPRVMFFFSPGFQSFGFVCGIGALLCIIFFFEKLELNQFTQSLFWATMIIVITFAMMISDCRGALFSLFISAFLFLFNRLKLISWKSLILTSTLFLITFLFISGSLTSIVYESASSRGSDSIISGRELIWLFGYDALTNASIYNILFGYGIWGSAISGVSYNYAFIFTEWENPELASLHNMYLQLVFDIGVIGLIVFFMALKRNTVTILNNNFYSTEALAVKRKYFVIFLLIFGIFDVSALPYFLPGFIITIILLIANK